MNCIWLNPGLKGPFFIADFHLLQSLRWKLSSRQIHTTETVLGGQCWQSAAGVTVGLARLAGKGYVSQPDSLCTEVDKDRATWLHQLCWAAALAQESSAPGACHAAHPGQGLQVSSDSGLNIVHSHFNHCLFWPKVLLAHRLSRYMK